MRKIACTVLVCLAAVGCGVANEAAKPAAATATASTSVSAQVVDPYLKIHAGLAKDTVDGLKASAGEVAAAAKGLGAPAAKVEAAATELAAAEDIKAAREKFGALSEAIDQYASANKLGWPQDVRKAWCPMVNKPWLQKGSEIANPYYGKEMPTCGEFK